MPVIGLPVGARRLHARLAADRGAVAPMVAMLISSGVLLGMAALVVDVGNLYAERAQLQSGADAAAVKAAQVCARSAADCTMPLVDDLVGRYAQDNARDGEAGASVCGRGGDLPECPAPSGGLTDCVRPAPPSGNYVEVHTNTLRPDGSTLLPAVFADAIMGGFEGAAVTVCARVAWGAPARARGLAMTISICDWTRDPSDGAAIPVAEQAIPLYDETDATACGVAGTSGANRGGFRWLDDAGRDCRATVSVGGSYEVTPGDASPAGCPEALTGLLDSPQPVLVPIFGSVSADGGGNATYTVQGFAAFVVTGWHLPGSDYPSRTRSSCDSGENACVFGYFTEALVPGGGAIGGPDLGARVVAPIG